MGGGADVSPPHRPNDDEGGRRAAGKGEQTWQTVNGYS